MQDRRELRTILVAAGQKTAAELRELFADGVRFVTADSYEQGKRLYDAERPHLVVVSYHFDEVRPYRLIHYIRGRAAARQMPIVLVRLQPGELGSSTEEEVRDAYERLGVQQFFSVSDQLDEHGRDEALRRMRGEVFRLARVRPLSPVERRSRERSGSADGPPSR